MPLAAFTRLIHRGDPARLDGEPGGLLDFDGLAELTGRGDDFEGLNALLRRPDARLPALRANFHRWTALLELDEVQRWLLHPKSWAGAAYRYDTPDGVRLVQATFLRRLKDLETRRDPSRLEALWRWAVEPLDVPAAVSSIWERYAPRLAATLVRPDREPIAEQERRFAALLREAARELAESRVGPLRWAVDALRRLAGERMPEALPAREVYAWVAFAWEDAPAAGSVRRPGLLVPFELRRRSLGWWQADSDWFAPREWFDRDFAAAMSSLLDERGECFPICVPRDELPPLSRGLLTGSSGKFAIGVAQALASGGAGRGQALAMPPWVVVTATARVEGGGAATSVGMLDRKLKLLRQEGVRVVVVADTQHEYDQLARDHPDLHFLAHGGGYELAAGRLEERGYTWPVQLRALKPKLSRRKIVGAAGAFAFAGVLLGLGFGRYGPHAHEAPVTRAIALSWDRRPELVELWDRCSKSVAALDEQAAAPDRTNPELGRLAALCRLAGLGEPTILTPGVKPPEADHAAIGIQTIAKHVAFDCSEWQPLHSEKQIREVPIEASFSTSVLQFRRRRAGDIRIAIEMNSGGFGVVPLLEPGDELVLGTKPMDEAGRITRTTYVIRTIPATWPDVFEVTTHSIYFNGFQDQQVRGKDSDWCAVRLHPGTEEASLAIVKPKRRTLRSIRRLERVEQSEEIDLGEPARFTRAAGEKLPVQDWYVWPIDTEDLTRPTIFSMRWKLVSPL